MKFGTKLKLKKDWEVGIIDFEVGDIFYVANYIHNQGIKLKHNGVKDLIDFNFTSQVRDKKIDEYFEVLSADSDLIEEYKQMMFDRNTEAQNMVSELRLKIDELKENDRLAELNSLIKKWFIFNDLNNEEKNWFKVYICSNRDQHILQVFDTSKEPITRENTIVTNIFGKTSKEMFDKAFEFFDTKKHLCSNCQYAWSYPYCPSTIKKFGDGYGLDNIISCDGHSKEDNQEQNKRKDGDFLDIGQYNEVEVE
jgi:hypothetical protein